MVVTPHGLSHPVFADLCAKLDRARDHLGAVEEAVRQIEKVDAYLISLDVENEGRKYIFRAHPLRKPTDITRQWGIERVDLLVGDFLYNLRASLDYSVYALATNTVPSLSEDIRGKLEFPIETRREGFESKVGRKCLGGVPPLAQAEIKRLQPYPHGPEEAVDPADDWIRYGLRELKAFSNIDKHRRLHVVQWGGGSTAVVGHKKFGLPSVTYHSPPYGDGAPVVTLRYSGPVTEAEVLMHFKFKWTVRMEGSNFIMPGFLKVLWQPVIMTIRRLEPFLT